MAVREAIADPSTYGYCLHACTRELREVAADWYAGRYRYPVDPDANVLALIGAQEGFANLLLATTDPGDTILLPDPASPSYFGVVTIAGLDVTPLALEEQRGFLPDLSAVSTEAARKARAMVLNHSE